MKKKKIEKQFYSDLYYILEGENHLVYNINMGNNIYIRVKIKGIFAGQPNVIIVIENRTTACRRLSINIIYY